MSTIKSYNKLDVNKVVGKNIVAARKVSAITREDLGALIGVSTSHMGLMERGERGVHALNLAKLSKIFNISIDDFFRDIDHRRSPTYHKPDGILKSNRKTIYALTSGLNVEETEYVALMIRGLLDMQEKPPSDDSDDSED